MKKALFSMAVVFGLTVAANAQSNDEAKAVAAARAAVNQNCGNTSNTTYHVQENFICNSIDGGFGNMNRTITFYRPTPCPNPNQPCIQVVETIGSATVDCEYNVTEVSCGGAVTQ